MRKNNKRIIRQAPTQSVNDGFANVTARLGYSASAGNSMSDGFFEFNDYTKNRIQLEAGYRSNWLCASLVDCIASDMTRAGLEFIGEIDPKEITDLQTFWQRTGIMDDLTDAIRWGRLYGGSILHIMCKNVDYSKPLDITKIKQNDFIGIHVYDRWELLPDLTNLIQEGRDIGLPEFYTITTLNIRVHHTHVIRFIGDKLPNGKASMNSYGAHPLLKTYLIALSHSRQ